MKSAHWVYVLAWEAVGQAGIIGIARVRNVSHGEEAAFHWPRHCPIYVFIFIYLFKISSIFVRSLEWGERSVFVEFFVFHGFFKKLWYIMFSLKRPLCKDLQFLLWGSMINKSLWNALWEFMAEISASGWFLLFEKLKLTRFLCQWISMF